MPFDQFERVNTELIYPKLLDRIVEVVEVLRKKRQRFVATHGFRTVEEQDELYAQGRTKPGLKVTNARGGQSQHNFGLAIDFVYDVNPDTKGVEPGWSKGLYTPLVITVVQAGLHSGVHYNDVPHVGWPGLVSAESLKPLKEVWEKSSGDNLARLQAVWQYVDGLGQKLPTL